MLFTVEMLPALDGDAIVVEWGEVDRRYRMLIDGGRGGKKLNATLGDWFTRHEDDRTFDLVVCTHMDADHISGLLGLFGGPPRGFAAGQIWFNAFRHLPPSDVLGWRQSDQLEVLIETFTQAHGTAWNADCTTGLAVAVADPPEESAPAPALPQLILGGMTITLLSPTVSKLKRVAREWPTEVRAARLEAPENDAPEPEGDDDILGYSADIGVPPDELARRPYIADRSPANGASIAFIAEYAGKRVLFSADSHAEVLEESLRRWQPEGLIRFDAVKLSHHGGAKNLSPELLSMLDCANWLISTNGSRHHHPDRRAIARLITRNKDTHLVFNYHTEETEEWAATSLKMTYGFTSHLPPDNRPGVLFDVMTSEARAP